MNLELDFARPLTQSQKILKYLQEGHALTPLDALKLFGCLRLGARIWELKREGNNIKTEWEEGSNNKKWAKYSLEVVKCQ